MERASRLTEAELAAALQSLPQWSATDGKWITRSYLFPTFPDAVRFVNRIAETAEQMNHHPGITIDYRRVTVKLTTWHAGGLTKLDLESAEAYDGLSLSAAAGEEQR
jgi:4a-hydroxytetrahydrobiopterin dehydratase